MRFSVHDKNPFSSHHEYETRANVPLGFEAPTRTGDLVIKHPCCPALHAILEGRVHVPNSAPVDIVRLEAEVVHPLRSDLAPLGRRQKSVKTGHTATGHLSAVEHSGAFYSACSYKKMEIRMD